MFSSPLPYKRPGSRYSEALPPPIPASPLRNNPPPAGPVHAYTYYAPSTTTAAPPLNHAYSAPAGWIQPPQPPIQQPEWETHPQPDPHPHPEPHAASESAWSMSQPVPIDHTLPPHTPQTPYHTQSHSHEQAGESEAVRLVRMMSRRRPQPPVPRPSQTQTQTNGMPLSPHIPTECPPPPAPPPPSQHSYDMYDTQTFSPSQGVFPLTISSRSYPPADADGHSPPEPTPALYQPLHSASQDHGQGRYTTYDSTYENTATSTSTSTSTSTDPQGSTTSSTNQTYLPHRSFRAREPVPEMETDSQVPSGTTTPLPPYVAYPSPQPQPPTPTQPQLQSQSQSQVVPFPTRPQTQSHASTHSARQPFHLAGDVKLPLVPPPPPPASLTDGNANPAAPEGILFNGTMMTMPNAREYASIPSYGASLSTISSSSSSSEGEEGEDRSSCYYTSEEESASGSDSEEGEEGRERQVERQRGTGEQRERTELFPSLHSQSNDVNVDTCGRYRSPARDDQARSPPPPPSTLTSTSPALQSESQLHPQAQAPSQPQLGRAGSIAATSIHSFQAGDEVGLTAARSTEMEQSAGDGSERKEENVAVPAAAETGAGVRAVKGDQPTLVYSYHPPPADVPTATANAQELVEIPLFCSPTSFQLLGQSLKRLLADLMISASTAFVPAPSAYASSSAETPRWRAEVWVRTFTLPVPPVAGALVVGGGKRKGGGGARQGKRWMVGGGYRTVVGLELEEEVTRPALTMMTSRGSGTGGAALALTRTRSSRHSHAGFVENDHQQQQQQQQQQTIGSTLPAKPAATTLDSTNTLLPAFTASHVLRLRLPLPLYAPFTASQLVETLHKHYQYGKRVGRSTTTSLAPGTVEENAYAFARMVDRAPGPVDEATRLSKAHKLGRTAFWDGRTVPTPPDERAGEDIQGQVGRKGFRYTMRKAVSKAVGAVQGEREDTVEDDRASWVTPFTG